MVVAGLQTMFFGADPILGIRHPSPSVDSEMRFYATWYAAAGAVLLWTIPRVQSQTVVVRVVGLAFFAAGCMRLLSLIVVGRPHTFALVLMVVEWVVPLVIVPWQAAVARAART